MSFLILESYLLAAFFAFAVERMLRRMNLAYAWNQRDRIPAEIRDRLAEGHLDRVLDYLAANTRFAQTENSLRLGIVLLYLFTGFLPWLGGLVGSLGTGALVAGVLIFVLFGFIDSLVTLPFEYYETFCLEAHYGFNRTTRATFWLDVLKGFLVKAVLGIPLAFGILWLIAATGRWWWLPVTVFVVVFQLLVLLIFPRFIAPLFNRFTPLPEGELKQRLEEFARLCHFPVRDIFVMDGSRRSAHSNAYFTGLGRQRRLVLYDTLLQQLTAPELTAVLAHEVGHYRKKHILWLLSCMALLVAGGAAAASVILGWPEFFRAFRLPPDATALGLIVLSLTAGPFLFWISPLLHLIQRHFEYQADAYAVAATGGAEALSSALLKLVEGNLDNLTPHPLYAAFHYSHPTPVERLAALASRNAQRPEQPSAPPAV